MDLITYNLEQFSVGVEKMDAQHKMWFATINRLHAALLGQDVNMSSEQAVKEMIDYTKFHFKQEEELMREVAYPGYEKHKQEHDKFMLEINKLEQDINNGIEILRTQIMSVLRNWLVDHICMKDMEYGTFISKSMLVE